MSPIASCATHLPSSGCLPFRHLTAADLRQGLNNGVRVVVALGDLDPANCVCILPASHKLNVEAPAALFDGADLGCGPRTPITIAPQLEAGDVLLTASRLLHGPRGAPNAIACEYVVGTARTSGRLEEGGKDEFGEGQPWFDSLTEEEKAVVGLLDGPEGRPVVKSDGDNAVIELDDEFHPSSMAPCDDDLIDMTVRRRCFRGLIAPSY